MILPFYKLQIAGNDCLLVDMQQLATSSNKSIQEVQTTFDASKQSLAAIQLCNRRYGVGANTLAVLYPNNDVRFWNNKGESLTDAYDALLCVARYVFDIGRAGQKQIILKLAQSDKILDVLGAHEFRVSVGSAFTFPKGNLITRDLTDITETISIKGSSITLSSVHIKDTVMLAFRDAHNLIKWGDFTSTLTKAFPKQKIIPSFIRCITKDTILVQTIPITASSMCAAACASLCAAHCSGSSNTEALVLFSKNPSKENPDAIIERDINKSMRLAVDWNTQTNDFSITGSGAYVFEGKFDLP